MCLDKVLEYLQRTSHSILLLRPAYLCVGHDRRVQNVFARDNGPIAKHGSCVECHAHTTETQFKSRSIMSITKYVYFQLVVIRRVITSIIF